MEMALRQRLAGVAAVSISESAQTTEVTFGKDARSFSADVFRGALQQAKVDVLTIDVDACGVIERDGDRVRLRAGKDEFLLRNAQAAPERGPVCVSGRLDEDGRPPSLDVSRVEAQ